MQHSAVSVSSVRAHLTLFQHVDSLQRSTGSLRHVTEGLEIQLYIVRNISVGGYAGDVVVDVGANVGVFSQQAATAVGKDGSVLSVEANPPTFRLLEENQAMLQQDGPLSTWHLVNAGVGSSDSGTLQMTFLPRAAGWGTCKGDQHMSLMKQDLKQFVRNMLEDKSSKVQLCLKSCTDLLVFPLRCSM